MESTTMMSLNQAAQSLQIGKPRLYRLITENKIKPIPDGNRKVLTDEQIKKLKKSISVSRPKPVQQQFAELEQEPVHTSSKNSSEPISETVRELLNAKDSEIEHLKKLLESEKTERAAERKERENYQAILLGMQKVHGHLLQASETVHLNSSELNHQNEGIFGKFSRVFKS
jgi:flagellar biosynthesis chaperone FliJ